MPSANAVVGATRYETAVNVAVEFFTEPVGVVGIASGERFPDGLAGGAHVGRAGGPLLLSPSASLASAVQGYLTGQDKLATAYLYGGTSALSAAVETATRQALE